MTTATTKIEAPFPDEAHALLRRLATRAMGLTGADVERIVRQARLKARREKRSICYDDLEAGIRMDRPQLPDDLRWYFAVHEAGHAVVHHALRLGPIHGLTIDTPSGGGHSLLGFTASGSDTLGYREDVLAMLMAGRAAEQIVVGSASAGSGGTHDSDLARATRLALAMERTLGFGGVHPLLYRDDKDPTAVLDANPRLAARVHDLLEKAQERATDILRDHRGTLDKLAQALFDAQALDEDAVKQLLKRRDRATGSE
ncbi:ATP-dependent Zn protease [Rhizobium rhizosphaerae]|uniref:ATP-dependent Zn protease n=1 Tax=Xaviernesmea rhizosphaerae TaxID=1672749 RepID=A0ABX3PC32_9HYPH|nr:ATP-dependent Zn protease [Xaviernesmea rhizosphaerae]OQP86039.1 ATP-dependent Zn protease [Xaviernesmea rhizosphaerae]